MTAPTLQIKRLEERVKELEDMYQRIESEIQQAIEESQQKENDYLERGSHDFAIWCSRHRAGLREALFILARNGMAFVAAERPERD